MAVTPEVFGNPFISNFMRAKHAGPFVFVIFGATGDLTHRKLIPALFNLYLDGFLSSPFAIVGYARRERPHEDFRRGMREAIEKYSRRQPDSPDILDRFLSTMTYIPGRFEDVDGFRRLEDHIKDIAKHNGIPTNTLYYLATPPDAFAEITCTLNSVGMVTHNDEQEPWSRIIVEKPFGHDSESAEQLNDVLHEVFTEKQIYRIDHYLGKETVQNILVFRLGNSIFEPLWNRRYIDHIQISVAESLGIGSRAGYFDQAGIIRDMIQSHIMQIFTLIAMEPPASFDATSIRDEKVKVLKSLRQYSPDEIAKYVVRGQYGPGSIGGEPAVGYCQEEGVPPGSTTDTFVAMKLYLDNWRWSGVPFYVRSGKRLPKRATEIAILFKAPPHLLFESADRTDSQTNILRFRIQPQEGISLSFNAKMPGQEVRVAPVRMDFMYSSAFEEPTSEAYERLLLDALIGDSTLFAREDEVMLSWRFVDRIINSWQQTPLDQYAAGEWGPEASEELVKRDHREWLRP